MPRSCSVCQHPKVKSINEALLASDPLRTIAGSWSVSKSALIRHKADHLPTAPEPSAPPRGERTPELAPESGVTQAAPLNAWDNVSDESGTAHAAFLIYRDLGATRTLNAAYHFHLRPQGQGGRHRGRPV